MTHPADNPALQQAVRRVVQLLLQQFLYVYGRSTLGEIAEVAAEEKRKRGRR